VYAGRIQLVEGGESGADCEEDGPEMVNQLMVVFTAVIVQSNVHGTRTTRKLRAGVSGDLCRAIEARG
jgi:hypothetical protein